MSRYGLLNGLYAGVRVHFFNGVLKQFSRHSDRNLTTGQLGKRSKTDQTPFQLTDVVHDRRGEIKQRLVVNFKPFVFGFASQNSGSRLQFGGLNVGNQAPRKTRAQTFFQTGDIFREFVRRQHDLLVRVVQDVEGVEKFFLSSVFPGDKLDVIDHQHITIVAITSVELFELVVTNSVNHLVHELFGRSIDNARFRHRLQDLVADSMQQMGFSEADPSIHKERVVAVCRQSRHGNTGSVCKLVGRSYDKAFKGVVLIELRTFCCPAFT